MTMSRKKHRYQNGKPHHSASNASALTVQPVSNGHPDESLPEILRLELLPIRTFADHLLNCNIDNVVTATYARSSGKLKMKCHFVTVFDDGEVNGLQLQTSVPDGLGDSKVLGNIAFKVIQSPGVAASHPDLAWAAKSRFPVDVEMNVPGLKAGDVLALAATVSDAPRIFSRVYVVA